MAILHQSRIRVGPIFRLPFRFPSGERRNYSRRGGGVGSTFRRMAMRSTVLVLAVLCSCILAVPAKAQQQQEPEDPENEKQVGLWLDQGISTNLSANKSLDVEFYERFDEGAS